jgi:hypothetical protein
MTSKHKDPRIQISTNKEHGNLETLNVATDYRKDARETVESKLTYQFTACSLTVRLDGRKEVHRGSNGQAAALVLPPLHRP